MTKTESVNLREIIVECIMAILEEGEYSHLLMPKVLDKYQFLDKNMRAFLSRSVMGTVERKIELDTILDTYSNTPVSAMKPLIRNLLRMAVYELRYMDSVPERATCNEAVKIAKRHGFSGLSGFVNGILRNIARNAKPISLALHETYSVPKELWQDVVKDYGEDKAKEIFAFSDSSRGLCVRTNPKRIASKDFIKYMEKEGIRCKKADDMENVFFLYGVDYLSGLQSFRDGLFYVQDISALRALSFLPIKEGDQVLDVCAAPGGKSLYALQCLAGDGTVLARDISQQKTELIKDNIIKSGYNNIEVEVWSALVLDKKQVDSIDVVLADLPCSGLGVLAKKPEIKYRIRKEDILQLAKLQQDMLSVVCQYVKQGGVLFYSTCTVSRRENEDNVREFLRQHEEFSLEFEKQFFPTKEADGFFAAILRRQ